jgi:NitT/TauT family transport system substrate-binding protein
MTCLPKSRVLLRAAAAVTAVSAAAGGTALSASASTHRPHARSLTPVAIELALVPPKMIFMGFYVAQAEGFFRRNGLNVQLLAQPTGNQAIRGVAAGEGVFAAGGGDAVASSDVNGASLQVIWTYGLDDLSLIGVKSITSVKDLPGHTIGVTDKSGPSYTMPVIAMERARVDPSKANYVILGGRPALVGALVNGQIQAAAFHVDDGLNVLAKDPNLHVIAQMSQVAPSFLYGPLAVSRSYAAHHKKVVQKVLTSLIEAQRWMYTHPSPTIALAIKDTQEPPSVVRGAYQILTKNHDWVENAGTVSKATVNYTLRVFKSVGVIDKLISYSTFVAPQYVNTVLKQIGTVKCGKTACP